MGHNFSELVNFPSQTSYFPELDVAIVPIGGGGLIAGIASAIKKYFILMKEKNHLYRQYFSILILEMSLMDLCQIY